MIEKIHHDSICILPKLKNALRDTAKEKKKLKGGKNQGAVKQNRQRKQKGVRSLCPYESSASIKEQIGTTIVTAFLAVTTSKHVLVPHCAHRLVVNVQPCLTAATATTPGDPSTTGTATGIRVKHIEGVVTSASGHAVVVEHAVEGIASRAPAGRRHDIYHECQLPSLTRS